MTLGSKYMKDLKQARKEAKPVSKVKKSKKIQRKNTKKVSVSISNKVYYELEEELEKRSPLKRSNFYEILLKEGLKHIRD